MTTITFTQTSMQTGKFISLKEFANEKEAFNYFHQKADELGYDNMTEDVNSVRRLYEVGGIGHDYRLELEVATFTGNPTL